MLVNINPAYRPFELKYVLKQSDAVALFLVDQFKTSDYFAMLAEVCPELAARERRATSTVRDFPSCGASSRSRRTPAGGHSRWDEMVDRRRRTIPQQQLDEIEPPAHSPASRSTFNTPPARPAFPRRRCSAIATCCSTRYYVGECQDFTAARPDLHSGAVLSLLRLRAGHAGLRRCYGAAMVVPAEYFQADGRRSTPSSRNGRPRSTACRRCSSPSCKTRRFAGRELTSLRTGIMAGSPCPIEVMRQVIDEMGAGEITIAYGQTEASPVITQTRTDDPLELRVETVGRPLPGVEVKIVDPATGETLGDNEQGELCARGHVVMLGYYNNPEATAAAIDADGWLHTGDLAVRLPNGYYKITGRIKDMVIRGGENIYPREIEEFLFTHPAVEQAAVVGVPDPKYGEELCAWIKLKAGAVSHRRAKSATSAGPSWPTTRCRGTSSSSRRSRRP